MIIKTLYFAFSQVFLRANISGKNIVNFGRLHFGLPKCNTVKGAFGNVIKQGQAAQTVQSTTISTSCPAICFSESKACIYFG